MGIRNSTYVEIKSGLTTSDKVYYTKKTSFDFGGFGNFGGMGGNMPNFGGGNMPSFGGSSGRPSGNGRPSGSSGNRGQ